MSDPDDSAGVRSWVGGIVTQRKNYGTDKLNLLSLYVLERLSSSTVGIILYINPLLGFVIAISFYGEQVDWKQGVAYGVVVVSIILFNWGKAIADEATGH